MILQKIKATISKGNIIIEWNCVKIHWTLSVTLTLCMTLSHNLSAAFPCSTSCSQTRCFYSNRFEARKGARVSPGTLARQAYQILCADDGSLCARDKSVVCIDQWSLEHEVFLFNSAELQKCVVGGGQLFLTCNMLWCTGGSRGV